MRLTKKQKECLMRMLEQAEKYGGQIHEGVARCDNTNLRWAMVDKGLAKYTNWSGMIYIELTQEGYDEAKKIKEKAVMTDGK